jgi:hypothetical protein
MLIEASKERPVQASAWTYALVKSTLSRYHVFFSLTQSAGDLWSQPGYCAGNLLISRIYAAFHIEGRVMYDRWEIDDMTATPDSGALASQKADLSSGKESTTHHTD